MAELRTEEQPFRSRAREIAKRIFRHENAVLVIILVIIIAALAVMTKGVSVSTTNVRNILLQSSMRGIAAMGQLFVILTAGIDLSVGGIAIFSAILGASLITERVEESIIAAPLALSGAIPVMLLLGLGVGAFNGVFVSRVRVPALIVTLSMWQMARGGAYQVCKGYTILGLPRSLAFFGQGVIAGAPVPVIIFIVVAVVAYFILYHTTFGRSIYAVGGNPVSAWLSGIKVPNILFWVYTISGFLAALAALITISRTMSASMVTAAGLELDTIAAVCIGGVSLAGGRGTLIGAVIGVIIIGVINNGMNVYGLDPAFQELVRGGIILAAVTADVVRRR